MVGSAVVVGAVVDSLGLVVVGSFSVVVCSVVVSY